MISAESPSPPLRPHGPVPEVDAHSSTACELSGLDDLSGLPVAEICGRSTERAVIDEVLARARAGDSGVVVVRGEAGIGKTALLEYAAAGAAADMRVLRGTGVESETKLPFSGLHLLLAPVLHLRNKLPGPQSEALGAAFGLVDQARSDRFLLGLATLSLLGEVAAAEPLLVLVDDTQWLDRCSAAVLSWVARRLRAEGVALLFAVRDGYPTPAEGVPDVRDLRLTALDRGSSAMLLGDLAGHVKDHLLAEAQGNPLALLELSAALTPEQRAGELPGATFHLHHGPMSGQLESAFAQRVRALPERTRSLLLAAAADDSGDLHLVLTAGRRLGADVADLEPAEDDRMVHICGDRLRFTHPLFRAAAYRSSSLQARLAAHAALAEAFGESGMADRSAWHRAAAVHGADESVAAEMERTAENARARGGHAAVATAYHRAAQLTSDLGKRARRLDAAAQAALDAGMTSFATHLADRAWPIARDPTVRAGLAMVRAAIAQEQDLRARPEETVEAAAGLAKQAPDTAATMLLFALISVWSGGEPYQMPQLAASTAIVPRSSPMLADVTAAIAHLADERWAQAVPHIRSLVHEISSTANLATWQRITVQWWFLWLADIHAAQEGAVVLADRCQAQGNIGLLPRALLHLARTQLLLGRHRDVLSTSEEGLRVAAHTEQPHFVGHHAGLLACVAAIEGDQARCAELTEDILADGVSERGIECVYARALLDLGHGQYEAVLRRLTRVPQALMRHHPAIDHSLGTATLVEAAVRQGHPTLAVAPLARLRRWAHATGQPWTVAIAARCQAQLADGEEAERHYEQAIRLHRQDDAYPFEAARTHLLYGEFLRRRRQRNRARPLLRSALDTFEQLGAAPWIDRVRAELRATGETSQPTERTSGLLDRLTSQELQVVRLAAAGLSNAGIAARLYLSPRTVGYHLYKAYPKLGISSRNDLARMDLGPDDPDSSGLS
ncbi:helix-turn-helix transcriptional regulator [Nonomuraea longispora]|uniref:Helix-turn-helix transcriptional regulator n=1 Tax=Nonomuraea longispora TaxID=1848320 RepID=A0A4R4N5W0_9ACTN|nr:helix-turn-helix transcriptional regulator [Nonomuraea longispora]